MTSRTPSSAAGAPLNQLAPAAGEPSEAEMLDAVLDASRVLGWRCAHFRPARTQHGWRTAVQGDGAGFPDCLLVHPGAGRILFAELKAQRGRLSGDQERWGEALIAAGETFTVVRGRAGLTSFIDTMTELADRRRR